MVFRIDSVELLANDRNKKLALLSGSACGEPIQENKTKQNQTKSKKLYHLTNLLGAYSRNHLFLFDETFEPIVNKISNKTQKV